MISAKFRLRFSSVPLLISFFLTASVLLALPADAFALSRGFAAKIRHARQSAYVERLQNARAALDRGDNAACVQEAQLALPHAADTAMARPAHELLAVAYARMGNEPAAQAHLDWLTQNASN